MKCSVILSVLALCTFISTAHAESDCTMMSCSPLSKDKINELNTADLHELFFDKQENIKVFKEKYASLGGVYLSPDYHYIPLPSFEEWYSTNFENFAQEFKSHNKYALETIQSYEKDFQATIPDNAFLADQVGTIESFQNLTQENAVCKLAVKKSERSKRCDSRGNSCLGPLVYLFSGGFFGSRNCRQAYAYCDYDRAWEMLIKYKKGGDTYVAPSRLLISSSVHEAKHRYLLLPLALKAKKEFNRQEKSIKKMLSNIPKCK